MPSDYEQIRTENIKEYGEGTRHLAFLSRLYTDRTHFIFELLQNAEDAGASKIMFILFQDKLEVKHDGRPFNEKDVRGVCGVGEGTKAEDLTQIGKFGIGFKSVYAYTSTPEVHSGEEHFRIDHYVRPCHAATTMLGDEWTTLFSFMFNAPDIDKDQSCKEISVRLCDLSVRTLLFLRNIKKIEYKMPDGACGMYQRKEDLWNSARQVNIFRESFGQKNDENWLVFERPVQIPGRADTVRVEIGFWREENDKIPSERFKNIKSIKNSSLVVYFPTEKETRFGFLIQGPYRTTPARDNIPKDDEWNKKLINETATLIVDSIMKLKDMGLLTVDVLEALPVRIEDFPSDGMFYPIVKAVKDAFLEYPLLPTDDGSFMTSKHVKLASAKWLRNLLKGKQLKELLQSTSAVQWISGEITENRTKDLWSYLKEFLEIEEITPDRFGRKIDKSFLEIQSNEWMMAFYSYLNDQPNLWKEMAITPEARGGYVCRPGPLRYKPFIRLINGNHVPPFNKNGLPNAYLPIEGDTEFPVVEPEITNEVKVLEFLKKLGLTVPDDVAEVIDKIIPKYSQCDSTVPGDEHKKDMLKIIRAFSTDSHEKKGLLTEKLKKLEFVLAKNSTNLMKYKMPDQSYLYNEDLLTYFDGNQDAWFVSMEYDDSCHKMFLSLGVSNKICIHRKPAGRNGHIVVTKQHSNHKRGLDGFDPEFFVFGLEHALKNPSLKKSMFVWNEIVIPNSKCIRGFIEKASNKSYEYSRKEKILSRFGQLLIESAWLPDCDNGNGIITRNVIFHKPSDLRLDDLPESFCRDEMLAVQLGMKKDVVAKLAEEAGISQDTIIIAKELESQPELLKEFRKRFEKRQASNKVVLEQEIGAVKIDYKKELEGQFNKHVKTVSQENISDDGAVGNPERRREKSYDEHSERLQLEPHSDARRKETIRTILEGPDDQVREYLYQMYGGECQICGKTFSERDGKQFFVASYIVPRKHARVVGALANALCLCAEHFAKWQHGAIEAENIIGQIESYKTKSEGGINGPDLTVKLCGEICKIIYKEKHLLDLQELLRVLDQQE
jgi:hypothetical protein